MKIIIISDCHLTDSFEEEKFNFLESIISKNDLVIINGDFWDKYLCDFDDFVESPWKKLFPLLKSKKTVYILGNHDKKEWTDDRINLFSDKQVENYDIKNGRYNLHIEHGNRAAPAVDEMFPWIPKNRLTVNLFIYFREKIPLRIYEKVLFNYYQRQNNRMKLWWKKNRQNIMTEHRSKKNRQANTILICGHSHKAEIDLPEGYLNSGFIRFGYGQYLMLEDGQFALVKDRY
jgi:predicted phosphodiesterase